MFFFFASQALADYLNVPPSPSRPQPGRGNDRHHAAYIAWIVVLVFGFASAVIFLVHEHRPKLLLSASSLGRSMRNMGGGGGGGGAAGGYDTDDHDGGWRGGGADRRGRRPRGALTEMVMESDIGVAGSDASYRLLEDDDEFLEAEGEEEGRSEKKRKSPERRAV